MDRDERTTGKRISVTPPYHYPSSREDPPGSTQVGEMEGEVLSEDHILKLSFYSVHAHLKEEPQTLFLSVPAANCLVSYIRDLLQKHQNLDIHNES